MLEFTSIDLSLTNTVYSASPFKLASPVEIWLRAMC